MTKSKMEGSVSRAVDFNLKKEDLMLLILEGRKEMMEEGIAKLQNLSTELKNAAVKAQEKFREKVHKLIVKSVNKEAITLAKSVTESNQEEPEKNIRVVLTTLDEYVTYVRFSSRPIGDSKGAGTAYIKSQNNDTEKLQVYSNAKVSVSISFSGKMFANKSDIYGENRINPCAEYAREFMLINNELDRTFQQSLPEYKELKKAVEDFTANETLLSDVLAEYDLFNRNQPRAKAKMIKEVLTRDDSGLALLENIMEAAKGTKLLALSTPKA